MLWTASLQASDQIKRNRHLGLVQRRFAAVGTGVQNTFGGLKHLVNQLDVFHGCPMGIGQQFTQQSPFTVDLSAFGRFKANLRIKVSNAIGNQFLKQLNGRALQNLLVQLLRYGQQKPIFGFTQIFCQGEKLAWWQFLFAQPLTQAPRRIISHSAETNGGLIQAVAIQVILCLLNFSFCFLQSDAGALNCFEPRLSIRNLTAPA